LTTTVKQQTITVKISITVKQWPLWKVTTIDNQCLTTKKGKENEKDTHEQMDDGDSFIIYHLSFII
jgi:hypothetical protein